MSAPLKIAIIRTTSLGDVILASAVLDFLAKLPIAFTITWLGRPPTLGVLAESYPQLRPVPLTKAMNWWQLYGLLTNCDVVIDLQQSLKTRAVCSLISWRGKAVVGFSDKLYGLRHSLLRAAKSAPRERQLPDDALRPPLRQYQVAVRTAAAALRQAMGPDLEPDFEQALNQAAAGARPRLRLGPERLAATEAKIAGIYPGFRSDQPLVAVAPGASYATKRAPVETFARIITNAHAESKTPFSVVLLGDGGDSKVCAELQKALSLGDSQIFDISGKLSFVESIATLALCRVVVGNDSVLPHGAEALGRPCLTLFGPTIEGFGFAPFREASASVSVNIGCRPCSKHGQAPCRYGDLACFTQLPTAEIAARLADIVAAP